MIGDVAVRALAYIGVAVEDPAAWLRFGTEVLGMMPAAEADLGMRDSQSEGPSGSQIAVGSESPAQGRLRLDHRAWRIAVEQGSSSDIAFAGYEVAGEAEWDAIRKKLTGLGIEVTEDTALASNRGVTRLLRCSDPTGIQIEIVCGATDRFEHPFVSPAGVSSFVAGDQGLGHVVLGCDDIQAMRAFYVDALGFRPSDRIRMSMGGIGKTELEFYHCNPRHHTLALVPVRRPRRIFHFMVQVANIDDVGFALDRVQAAGAKITSTLGRHTNDHMFSFYAATPGGIEVEFGYGARTIDDAVWREALHHKPSMWGHKRS